MEKVVSLQKVEKPIKVKTVKMVRSKCPTESGDYGLGHREDFNYQHCLSCSYKGEKENSCGWYEYPTTIIRERSTIENDPWGADVPTDYYRTIECANCGSEITFYSSYSSFVRGDHQKCPECGLLYTFLRHGKKKDRYIEIFAIPITEWEKKTSNSPKRGKLKKLKIDTIEVKTHLSLFYFRRPRIFLK